jgi:hypothetical protein
VFKALPVLLAVFALAGWTSGNIPVPPGAIRPPGAKTDMDTNPANLASAVVTHAFGQLPDYIDAASYRLLPFDMYRASEMGRTVHRLYRITTPRTSLVLDTAVATGLTTEGARADAAQYRVAVSLDGRVVPHLERYWVFYRNNGPQICRIYFPGDLGSLHMGAQSLVLRPPAPGNHRLHVVVRQRLAGRVAVLVTDYALRVLPRRPNAKERAIAPRDDADPATLGNTPLAYRTPKG